MLQIIEPFSCSKCNDVMRVSLLKRAYLREALPGLVMRMRLSIGDIISCYNGAK